jgi:hypothetical protein
MKKSRASWAERKDVWGGLGVGRFHSKCIFEQGKTNHSAKIKEVFAEKLALQGYNYYLRLENVFQPFRSSSVAGFGPFFPLLPSTNDYGILETLTLFQLQRQMTVVQINCTDKALIISFRQFQISDNNHTIITDD